MADLFFSTVAPTNAGVGVGTVNPVGLSLCVVAADFLGSTVSSHFIYIFLLLHGTVMVTDYV